MPESIISASGLSKAYKLYARPQDRLKELFTPWRVHHSLFYALDNINFELARGEHLGIVGANGSGKSTLLKILTGVLNPTAGNAKTKGRIAALLELGAGFNPELTGRENVEFLLPILFPEIVLLQKGIEEIADFAEIGDFIDQPVKTYSSGMFARLAFAMSIVAAPDILIIDEVLAVGDAFFQQKCMRRMKEYREKGTVLFVSHDIGSIANLCTKVLWLDNGKVREFGDADTVCKHYIGFMFSKIGKIQELAPAQESEVVITVDADENHLLSNGLKNIDNSTSSRFENFDYFGTKEGIILDAGLESDGKALTHARGGETCLLTCYFKTPSRKSRYVVGFIIKNRLGEGIIGTNTQDEIGTMNLEPGIYGISFRFTMPYMLEGEYTMALALAEGTCEASVQLHWIHDALSFTLTRDWDRGVAVYVKPEKVSLCAGKSMSVECLLKCPM